MIARIAILFLLLICRFGAIGQSEKTFLRTANKLYDAGVWTEAAPMYLTLLQQAYDKEQNERLADCYFQLGNYKEAAAWFLKLIEQEQGNPELLRKYADVLKHNGKYHLAKMYYLKFAVYDDAGYYLAGTCDYAINNLKVDSLVWLEPLPFNSAASEIAPAYFRQGILFASDAIVPGRKRNDPVVPATGTGFYNLQYAVVADNGLVSQPQAFKELNSALNDAAVSYDVKNEKIYISRNNILKGRQKAGKDKAVHLSIFTADLKDEAFGRLKPFKWNDKHYSVGHPCISGNGKLLFFTSDMDGGYGGTDIYYCKWQNNEWSEPVNLGPVINTPGNEGYPYVSVEGRLYFTSDYHPGFGGLDIFWSERAGESWSRPINPGMPVNSGYDDFACIIDNGFGYLTSNRPGGRGSDDVYRITFMQFIEQIHVINSKDQPVAGAQVILLENDHRIEAGQTDSAGTLSIQMEPGNLYTMTLFKEGYLDAVVYDLEQYKSNTGQMTIHMQDLYGTDETHVQDSETDSEDIISDTISTESNDLSDEGIFNVFIGSFKDPEYTKLTSLARFGELSVKSENGEFVFYVIGITSRSKAEAALEAALAAGFSDAVMEEAQ